MAIIGIIFVSIIIGVGLWSAIRWILSLNEDAQKYRQSQKEGK